MKKLIMPLLALVCITACVLLMLFGSSENYMLISVIILVLSMLPFFASFESYRPSARELSLLSAMIAIAVVSRAAFYLIPQVKPIAAVVIIGAVCMGEKSGYILGAFSAFISNFIFSQGAWTPFQMVGLGLVGFFAGLIFKKIRVNKWLLSGVGFILVFAVYGIIADTSTVMFMVTDFNLKSVLAVYGAGVPFSFIFALTTAVCLFLFGEQFIKKIKRINIKYGMFEVYENG
ncbi:MAG: ECF transporter S component [Eubacterium sp.]|nr:ECF transporter S component [Eubacterium sp.]